MPFYLHKNSALLSTNFLPLRIHRIIISPILRPMRITMNIENRQMQQVSSLTFQYEMFTSAFTGSISYGISKKQTASNIRAWPYIRISEQFYNIIQIRPRCKTSAIVTGKLVYYILYFYCILLLFSVSTCSNNNYITVYHTLSDGVGYAGNS